jgi:hypothetical protein
VPSSSSHEGIVKNLSQDGTATSDLCANHKNTFLITVDV